MSTRYSSKKAKSMEHKASPARCKMVMASVHHEAMINSKASPAQHHPSTSILANLLLQDGEPETKVNRKQHMPDSDWHEEMEAKGKRKTRKKVKLTRTRPRRDMLEEAVAERLKLETTAEEEAQYTDSPLTKRPRMAAKAHQLRKIVHMLTEEDESSPEDSDPGADLLVQPEEQETDPESEQDMEQELNEITPEPETEPELEEMEPTQERIMSDPQRERATDEAPTAGRRVGRRPADSPGGRPSTSSSPSPERTITVTSPEKTVVESPKTVTVAARTVTVTGKTSMQLATTGSAKTVRLSAGVKTAAAGPKTGSAVSTMTAAGKHSSGSARTVTIAKEKGAEAAAVTVVTDLRQESRAEERLISSMLLPLLGRRMRCCPRMKQLQARLREVYRAAAEYQELHLSAYGGPPAPVAGEDCVPPGSRGRRLVVLRQQQQPSLPQGSESEPTPSATPSDLTDLLREERGSMRETMLPPTTMTQAMDTIHELRLQNLRLQAALMRTGAEPLRGASQLPPLRRGRGSHKELAMVHATRLKRLEDLEAGLERVYSPRQIAFFAGETTHSTRKWSEKDLRRAVQLRIMCTRRVFDYVRGPLGLPLPSMDTIRQSCKLYPDLEEALDNALCPSAPRRATSRGDRLVEAEDADTETQTGPAAPARPRKGRRLNGSAAGAGKKAHRTGKAVRQGARKGPASWKYLQDAAPEEDQLAALEQDEDWELTASRAAGEQDDWDNSV